MCYGLCLSVESTGLASAGKEAQEESIEGEETNAAEVKSYRGLATGADNVGLDRPDTQFCASAREACRSSSRLLVKDSTRL